MPSIWGGVKDVFVDEAVEEIIEEAAVEEAAMVGFETALAMCGNNGQTAIIEQMGEGAFVEAAEAASSGADALAVLESSASHPEAVEIILAEAAQAINQVLRAAGADSEGEE